MFSSFTTYLLLIGGITATYYLVLLILFRKKLAALLTGGHAANSLQLSGTATAEFPHELIDRPLILSADSISLAPERTAVDDGELVMVEDEESLLLKAAEIVVEKVQDVVNHIASHPPNPVEVFTKIKAIVSPYTIFHNTDYFDAINSFIAISVERDCAIQFTKEELLNLWN